MITTQLPPDTELLNRSEFNSSKHAVEFHGAIIDRMGELVGIAKQEARDITVNEQKLFNQLERRVGDLRHLIAAKRGEEMAPGYPSREEIDPDGPQRSRYRTDPRYSNGSNNDGIVRAIRNNDSFESELRRLYPGHLDSSGLDELRFGDMCRAMVNGPQNDIERRALSEGTDSAGGFTVPTFLSARLIDRLRAKSTIFKAGAQTIPLTTDSNKFAKLATDPTATWRLENASISDNSPTFSELEFTPRSLVSLVKASRELIADSTNMNEALEHAFAEALSLELDRVAFVGSGSAPEPQGLFTMTNVNEVDMGTNGAAVADYSQILDAIQLLEAANADTPTAMVMHSRTKRAYESLVDTTEANRRIPPAAVTELPRLVTTQIPIDQTQGSASNASSIFLGNFSELVVGMRAELQVEVLKERYSENYQFGFLAHLRADIQCWHAESFARIVGVIPS